ADRAGRRDANLRHHRALDTGTARAIGIARHLTADLLGLGDFGIDQLRRSRGTRPIGTVDDAIAGAAHAANSAGALTARSTGTTGAIGLWLGCIRGRRLDEVPHLGRLNELIRLRNLRLGQLLELLDSDPVAASLRRRPGWMNQHWRLGHLV